MEKIKQSQAHDIDRALHSTRRLEIPRTARVATWRCRLEWESIEGVIGLSRTWEVGKMLWQGMLSGVAV